MPGSFPPPNIPYKRATTLLKTIAPDFYLGLGYDVDYFFKIRETAPPPGQVTDFQGRFRGKDCVYLESEYRFGILRNGLIGGVVFVNAQSFTEPITNRFEAINPGWGGGIRIKLNKFSRTNICLDYGFGLHGSGGIFANLGEVF